MTELKNIVSIGSGQVIGSIIGLIFWIYLAKILDVETYGEIHYFLGIAGIAYLIALIGTPYAITVYTAKKINLVSTLILLSLIAGTVISLIVLIIFDRVDVSLIIISFILFESVSSYLVGKKLYLKNSIYFIIQKILMVILSLLFYSFFGPEGIILGISISYIHYIIILVKIFKNNKIEFKNFKEKQKFNLNNYFMNIVGGFRGQIDKIIIAPLIGFEILGLYALTLQAYAGLMIVSNSIFKYILPHQAAGTLNKKIELLAILISMLITLIGFILAPIGINRFFPEYEGSIVSIQIICFAVIPSTITLIVSSRFLGDEKSSQIFISRVIMLITLTSGIIILGSLFYTPGAAVAFLISHIVQTITLCFFYFKHK